MGLHHSLASHYRRHRFLILFATLLIAIGGHGFAARLLPVTNPFLWLVALSLVAAVFSVRRGRLRWTLAGLVALCVAARLIEGLLDHPAPVFVGQSFAALACVVAAGVAVHRALASGPVDVEHISAALDAYLLAGIAFGVGYWMMEAALPGSFSSSSPVELTPVRAIYFSFVTQATVGYGDIVPANEHAEGVMIVQGVGGQMYLAVLVARLVSLYSAQESRSFAAPGAEDGSRSSPG